MNSALNCLLNNICRPAVVPCLRQLVFKICVWKAYLFSLSFVNGDTLVLDTSLRRCVAVRSAVLVTLLSLRF